LGGTNSIRGYEERAYRADIGVIGSVELVSPPLHPLLKWAGYWDQLPSWSDELRFLVFFDYGYGEASEEIVVSDISQTLASYGVGLRWKINDNFNLRLDYGIPIIDLDAPPFDEDASDPRVHIGGVFTF